MRKSVALLALTCGLAAAPAFAQGWYMGFGVGRGNLDVTGQDLTGLSNASVKDNATTYTVRGGYRLTQNWALELGYYDLGDYDFSGSAGPATIDGSARAKSFGLSVVGIAPLSDAFEVYARVGIEESEVKVNASAALGGNANASEKDTGATYGVGARWMFTKNFGLFAEWMRNDKIEVDSYLGGIDFRF